MGKLVEFRARPPGRGWTRPWTAPKAPSLAHHFTLPPRLGEQVPGVGEKLAFFPSSSLSAFSLPPRGKIRLNYFRRNQARITKYKLSGSFKCAKERGWSEKKIFFFLFWRSGKEPVCVRLPCDSGSCLLAGASIPNSWGQHLAQPRRVSIAAAQALGRRRGANVPAAARRPRSLPRPRVAGPAEPRCGPFESQSGALLWLVDCVSRMRNLLIS